MSTVTTDWEYGVVKRRRAMRRECQREAGIIVGNLTGNGVHVTTAGRRSRLYDTTPQPNPLTLRSRT